MVKIVWTEQAIQDLDDIGEYIANDSERYSRQVVQTLFDSVDLLESHPKAGRMVPEYGLPHLRELISGNYRVVYRIADKYRVDIITVHHSARLLKIPRISRKKM